MLAERALAASARPLDDAGMAFALHPDAEWCQVRRVPHAVPHSLRFLVPLEPFSPTITVH